MKLTLFPLYLSFPSLLSWVPACLPFLLQSYAPGKKQSPVFSSKTMHVCMTHDRDHWRKGVRQGENPKGETHWKERKQNTEAVVSDSKVKQRAAENTAFYYSSKLVWLFWFKCNWLHSPFFFGYLSLNLSYFKWSYETRSIFVKLIKGHLTDCPH